MLAQWLGCSDGDAVDLTIALGYRRGTDGSLAHAPQASSRASPENCGAL